MEATNVMIDRIIFVVNKQSFFVEYKNGITYVCEIK